MPIQVEGLNYYTNTEVSEELGVSRQTLWRWRERGKIPTGVRYRRRLVLFTEEEVAEIRGFANKLEPIEFGGPRQFGLFGRSGN